MIKDTYICRMVGGSAVIRMPLDTVGTSYKQSVGKGGVIYLRPVEEFKSRESQLLEAEKNRKEDLTNTLKNDLSVSNLALTTVEL